MDVAMATLIGRIDSRLTPYTATTNSFTVGNLLLLSNVWHTGQMYGSVALGLNFTSMGNFYSGGGGASDMDGPTGP
jgi:hypothetical protein